MGLYQKSNLESQEEPECARVLSHTFAITEVLQFSPFVFFLPINYSRSQDYYSVFDYSIKHLIFLPPYLFSVLYFALSPQFPLLPSDCLSFCLLFFPIIRCEYLKYITLTLWLFSISHIPFTICLPLLPFLSSPCLP